MTTSTATFRSGLATDERRLDGREKVTGQATYAADVHRPGELWAAFAISPFAHAKILRIDTSLARTVDGVRAVLTAADIGVVRVGRQLYDWPVLASDVVRFAGERVAAVAAETRAAAERAAALIDVAYEELPAVLDSRAALAPTAPVLHPQRERYYWSAYSGKTPPHFEHPNIQGEHNERKGAADLTPLFKAAHRVFTHSFSTPRLHAGHIEPRACVVWVDDDQTVHVVSCSKQPYGLRDQMSKALGLSAESIIVYPAAIGGDFGGKGMTVDEYPCYFLSKCTGRPVRYAESYTDALRAGGHRHPARTTLETAVDPEGRFIAHRSTVLYDGGAYAGAKPGTHLLPHGTGYVSIPYQIPNVHLDVRAVYTNAAPGTHVRAPSSIQIIFSWEQHVDLMAAALSIDPVELRRRNTGRAGDTLPDGHKVWDWNGGAVLDALEREIDLHATLPAGRGRGIAFACSRSGGSFTALKMILTADGNVTVETAVPEQGVGMHTAIQRIAAETLGIEPHRVTVRRLATNSAPGKDGGVGGAWGVHVSGRGTLDAARSLCEAIEGLTGTKWCDQAFVDPAGRRFPLAAIAQQACTDGPVSASGRYDKDPSSDLPADYTFIALAIDVAVDRETGAYAILDVVQVVDVGTIINPVAHQGQLDGGFVYGLGSAAMEELLVDESGVLTTLSLGDYKLPTIADVPPLRTVLLHTTGQDGPLGAKAAGEVTNIAVPAALANAIANATGIRLDHFPITAERIFQTLAGHGTAGEMVTS